MFGFSFAKLAVLAAIVLVVWYGFKYRARIEAVRAAFLREAEARRARARPAGPRQTLAAEDLVKCDRCGSFVAPRATSCGRPDCPWGR